MLLLLEVLAVRAPDWWHGYELMKATGLLSGTIYPLLMRMTDQGLVEAQWQEPAQPGRPARHAYRLTTAGLKLASEVAKDSCRSGSLPGHVVSPA